MYLERTNKELLEEMNKHVIGHEKAKKLLITLVNRSRISHRLKYVENLEPLDKMNLLLIGASGTGKTYMLETLSKLVGFPLVKVDASKINPTGNNTYAVKDIEQAILFNARLMMSTYPDTYFSLEGTVSRTVVFMDEFDKLALEYGTRDAWQQRAQSEILTLVENSEMFKEVSFVFAGAFTNLRKEREIVKESIGFVSDDSIKQDKTAITEKDLVNAGVITELMGRINAFTELDVLTYEMMEEILETQLIPKKLEQLKYFDTDAASNLTKESKTCIIKDAMESGQGVRHMKRELTNRFLDMEFNYEDKNRFIRFDREDSETIDCT